MAAGDIIVQHGSITFGASEDTETATITAVGSLDSAFVICLGAINTSTGVGGVTNNPDDLTVALDLTNTTTVTATRPSTGNNNDVTIYFAVVEYVGAASGPNEFVVHRGSTTIGHGSQYFTSYSWTADTTTAEAIFIPSGFTSSATSHEGNSMRWNHYADTTGYDGASTSRNYSGSRASSSIVGTISINWQIVEFVGSNWRVYLIDSGASVGTESSPAEYDLVDYNYNPVDSSAFSWDRAFIIGSKSLAQVPDGTGGYFDPHDDANDQGWVCYPGNDTSGNVTAYVAVSNGTYSTSRHYFFGQVVYNVDSTFMTVEHLRSIDSGTISSLSAATTNDYTITDVSDTGYAFPLVSAYTDDTSTDLARAAYQAHLTSTTNLRLTRATSTGTGELAAQIIKFEAPAAAIELPHLSVEATLHAPTVRAPLVLPHLSIKATLHAPSLPSSTMHRDTRFGSEGTIATDLSQYATNLTASGVGAYEASSARTYITGERNIYYRGDLSTADSEDVLVRHGDQTTNTTNTYGLVVVTGGGSAGGFYGSTKVIEADLPSVSGTAQDYSIGWSTRANPDTTGASDAQRSMMWVYNHDTGERNIVHSTHAAPPGLDSYTFSVGGWWNGSSMQGSPANAPTACRVGTTFYSSVQYEDDYVGATPYSSAYAREVQRFPVTKASALGSDGQWYGPAAQYAAHHVGVSARRTASPLVNEIYRDAETTSWDGSGLYEPENRWIYAPGQTAYQMCSTYLRWIRVPLTYSRVRVRVNVSSWPNTGAAVPIGLACYSMERPPPWPTAWKRTAPVVATYTHTSASDREWVDLGELQIVRLLVPNDPALDQTTHLALAIAIDPAGASSNDTAARVKINAWQVVPAGPPSTDYSGPETPPNQQLQPLPIGGLSPFQTLKG